ncbi:hypothetical protein [Plantactinospora sp. KLBMP9567]|uniref:hypothetical protein n=1 Tax=Plantactinospora sp. KLBMP9567 TaxID=3085900 RepID=UPI0029818CFF|nr:hypothetical protein [Plantactinospora sp. KLBMP9567]MDW5324454.1 hypothetical protein [Plantactinospora sp. KLBMP9567]
MQVKSLGKAVGAVLAAALAVTAVASPASADPFTGFPPFPTDAASYRTLAGTGSDTTQDVLNGLGAAIGGGTVLASWDARGTSPIKTKVDNCVFQRPNGSTEGNRSLWASKVQAPAASTIEDCVDFARSSSGTTLVAGGNGTWIPFALDAVTYAINENSDLPTNMSLSLLQNIYKCVTETVGSFPVQPLLIQPGSGTRQFWNQQMGITDAEISAGDYPCLVPPSATVPDGTGVPPVQEHDGRELVGHNDYVMPFSIAQHIAQGNALPGVEDRRGPSLLGSINTVSPYAAGSNPPNEVLNPTFPLNRRVYNIVASSELTEEWIDRVFTAGGSFGSLLCDQSGVITTYGFATIGDCGSTTLTGNLNTAGWPPA